MLAVLRSAVDDFQKYVLGRDGIEKAVSRSEKSGFWRKIQIGFSLFRYL
jgi:hypothetical protein